MKQINPENYINTIRSMIEHESNLRNNRLTWMWALQGLLMTAAGVLWDKSALAVLIIGITGIVSSLSIRESIRICNNAVNGLRYTLKEHINENTRKLYPPEIGICAINEWKLPWNLLPSFLQLCGR